jgi:predicted porin
MTETLGLSGALPTSTVTNVTATISDNVNAMVLAKYTVDKLKLYAGYEWMQFANPSNPVSGFTDETGTAFCTSCSINGVPTVINNSAFINDRIQQVVWTGARYSLTSTIDVAAAYYHFWQNEYASGSNIAKCSVNSVSVSSCSGSIDAASVMIDWQFAPKWDTYIGTLYSKNNGGLDSGFQVNNNWATTAGLRFRW